MTAPASGGGRCRAPGCSRHLDRGASFCSWHWNRLPGALRKSLNRAYARHDRADVARLATRAAALLTAAR